MRNSKTRFILLMTTSDRCELWTTALLLVIKHAGFQSSFLVNSFKNADVCCAALAKGGSDGARIRRH
jgi:hypothetical protein